MSLQIILFSISGEQMSSVNIQESIFPVSIASRYRLMKKIGSGGMGDVYLVEDTRMGRSVALKAIRPELIENEEVRQRIERECKMHSAIPVHPHIVVLHEKKIGEDDNIFLIMEYVDGKNLSEIIHSTKAANSTIPLEKAICITTQILSALSSIHKHDIVHRDIKPSNIIISGWHTDEPCAKLMDFGIARDVVDNENLTKLTMLDTGGPGTPAYMAPERIDSTTFGEICAATDLYSVGIILYEMLCLKPPHHGTLTEIFSGHIAREPSFNNIQFFPETVQAVLNTVLAKMPDERYESAQQFADTLLTIKCFNSDETLLHVSLDSALEGGKTLLQTPHLAAKLSDNKNNNKRFLWGLLSVALLSGIIAVYYYYANSFTIDEEHKQGNIAQELESNPLPAINLGTESKRVEPKQPYITNSVQSTKNIDDRPVVTGSAQASFKAAKQANNQTARFQDITQSHKQEDFSANSKGSALAAFEAEIAKRKKRDQERLQQVKLNEEKQLSTKRKEQIARQAVLKKEETLKSTTDRKVAIPAKSKYIIIPIK